MSVSKKKSGGKGDIEWIPVNSVNELPDYCHFNNLIKPDFLKEPSISPLCTKNLSTPLDATQAFLHPFIENILKHTNEQLALKDEKACSEDEFLKFILFECAVFLYGSKTLSLQKHASVLRNRLLNELGVAADWPGKNRLQIIRSNLKTYLANDDVNLMSQKIKTLIDYFNDTAKQTITKESAKCQTIQDILRNACESGPQLVATHNRAP